MELPPLVTVVPAMLAKPVNGAGGEKVKSPVTFPPSGSVTVALNSVGRTLIIPVGKRLVGAAGALLAVMVKVYVVVRTIVPDVPLMVIGYIPGRAVPVITERVEAQVPALGSQDAGVSVIVAPAGGADLVRLTVADDVPVVLVTVIVELGGLLPWIMEAELGAAAKEKLNKQRSVVVKMALLLPARSQDWYCH